MRDTIVEVHKNDPMMAANIMPTDILVRNLFLVHECVQRTVRYNTAHTSDIRRGLTQVTEEGDYKHLKVVVEKITRLCNDQGNHGNSNF